MLAVHKTVPYEPYISLFELALKTQSTELLNILLKSKDALPTRYLTQAIGEASLHGLITKDLWRKIKEQIGFFSSTVQNIEEYNPLIRMLV